jgi:hypothetical protein
VSEVTCPTCGTVSQLDVNREAQAFCRVCDYPLFWIRAAGSGEGESGVGDEGGLRRLPGTAGLVTVATVSCWNCDERNPINAIYCIRCGLNLHPAPPEYHAPAPPPEFVPEPEPVVPPPKKPLIPPEWIPALVVATILLLLCLIGLGWVIFH